MKHEKMEVHYEPTTSIYPLCDEIAQEDIYETVGLDS